METLEFANPVYGINLRLGQNNKPCYISVECQPNHRYFGFVGIPDATQVTEKMLYYINIISHKIGRPPRNRYIRVGTFEPPYSFLQADYMTPSLSEFRKMLDRVLEEENYDEVTHICISDLRRLFKRINKL